MHLGLSVHAMSANEQIDRPKEWLDINDHTGRYDAGDGKLGWYRDISAGPRKVETKYNLA